MDNSKNKKIQLHKLVDTFKTNIKQYKSSAYDEANTRVDYIDKFFELLDWDVRNTQGFSEQYREVVREDKVVIEGKPKAPDYSFRIGGVRKFFVEAKKPAVNIKEDIEPAYQIRRYSYTAKLPLAILTDFEEFAVYDTRIKPNKDDKASVARIFYCTYEEYEKHFEFIYNTFSKNAILKGSFDRYIEENKNKKGTSEVDKEFLKMIEWWREILARTIALRNKDLDLFNLNYAVQKIIDRLIFLRIAEDRRMEEYGTLYNLITEPDVYKKLNVIFVKADYKYNSGLFAIESWVSELQIDEKILIKIIKGLYYPESPYEYSVLPIEILGQVYEQFLGKTIRLTKSHQAKVEEKPEVRKAGGVYYTPQYIVNYIVKNTVGEKIKNKTPKDIESLSILDPACGSGSFLVGAYDFLLKYHLEYYSSEKNKARAISNNKIYQLDTHTYKLTIKEKQNILLNNIYGVDIDSQAVEVTKLSLLLKLMEDENVESQGDLFKHSDLKLLPDLSNNIKCGNSLIGSDYFEDKNLSLFGDDDMRKINPFDWEKEFSDIFKGGGFDVVIGNPPYIGFHGFKTEKNYLLNYYESGKGKFDIYNIFIEKAVSLIKNKGLISYICPTTFMKRKHGTELRKFIINNVKIIEIIDFEHTKIFKDALNYTGIFIFSKSNMKNNEFRIKYAITDKGFQYKQNKLTEDLWIIQDVKTTSLLDKIFNNPNVYFLDNYVKGISEGIVTGLNDLFLLSDKFIRDNNFEMEYFKPCIRGSNIRRYYFENINEFVFYPYDENDNVISENIIKTNCKNYYKFLKDNITRIKSREYFVKSNKIWYELWNQRKVSNFETIKIVVPELANQNRFMIDLDRYYYGDTVCGFYFKDDSNISIYYFLGILNSKLINWIYKKTTVPKANDFFIYKTMFLKRIPIFSPNKNLNNKVVP